MAELGWDLPSFNMLNADSLKAIRIWGQAKLDDVKLAVDANEGKITKILAVLDGTSDIVTFVKIEDCFVKQKNLAKRNLCIRDLSG